jgi:hypothetical protein
MAGFIDQLRSGDWLTRERVRLLAFAVLAACAIGLVFLVATSDGLNDRFGRPLGTDFSNVYAAGTYVLDGESAAPFDPARQYAREQAIFGQATGFYGWHYPPFFLGLAALLATMPFWLALLVWQSVTLALYLWATKRIVGAQDKLWLLLAVAFPAVFINLGHGHNGFLTAALMAGALMLLDSRPVVAGILIGLLAYKPQFGVLIPLVLIASGRWRVFFAAAVTVALLALAVTLAFGVEVWTAFLASTAFTRTVVLEQGGTGWYKIQSVFSWVRMWGGTVDLAYAVQGAVTLIVAAALGWLWRARVSFAIQAAALLIGTVLATPYSLDYDLMLLAPAIAFLAADGMSHGFAPWEKTMLAALGRRGHADPARRADDAHGFRIFAAPRHAPDRRAIDLAFSGAISKIAAGDNSRNDGRRFAARERIHETVAQPAQSLRRRRLCLFPELLRGRRDRAVAQRSRQHPQARPPGSLARKVRRAAHRLCRAQVQQGFRGDVAASPAGRAADAVVRRERLRASVQAQRQGRLRGRRLAVAPGLRHLGARRRHAGAARDEHRDLSRRGVADQRRAHDHPKEP